MYQEKGEQETTRKADRMTANLQKLLGCLSGVEQQGNNQWQACCPCHDDRKASLSVGSHGGVVLVRCQAGCDTKDIVRSIGLEMKDLFPPSSNGHSRNGKFGKIVETYDYRDADGKLIFQAVRMEPKDFRQRQPKDGGGWKWSVKGCKVVPYRLPELSKADPADVVFIVEGEKDVDRLRGLGFTATCNAGGAGKWKPAHSEYLAGRHVVVLEDNDSPGAKHAQQAAKSLQGKAASVKVIQLPGLPAKGDVSDWLDAGGTADKLRAIVEAVPEWEPAESLSKGLPEVVLPGGGITITRCAGELGELLAKQKTHYVRGGGIVKLGSDDDTGEPILLPVKSSCLASDFERVAELQKEKVSKEGFTTFPPAVCSESNSRLIGDSQAFSDALPKIKVLSRCPVLVERDGELIEAHGYHEGSGVLAGGVATEDVPLKTAKELLIQAISDFRFASESDRSRALAALITPALVLGGLLRGRAPVDLGEADKSQTGKGYRNNITGAIYRHRPQIVNQRRGIGSLEEAFDKALISGASFIAIDNVRGKVDSPAIESFLTETSYSARTPYSPVVLIDPRRVVVMFTSNKADITRDLANRCSCVRILKQEAGYQYASYPEGDILAHVQDNQPRYLGAVFAIVKAWHAAGKPRTTETRHDFRPWAQSLDYIVQNLLGAAPLMEGHQETQDRMTNPALNWLRDVAQAVVGAGKAGEWLRAYAILDIIGDDTGVEIPGLTDGANVEDDNVRGAVLGVMGRRFKKCFGDRESVEIGLLRIDRIESVDENCRRRFDYQFSAKSDPRVGDYEGDVQRGGAAVENGKTREYAKSPALEPKSPALAPCWPRVKNPISRVPRPISEYMCVVEQEIPISEPLCTNAGNAGENGIAKPKMGYVEKVTI